MKKSTIILISVLSIVACVAIAVGTTVAFFTGNSSINISFTAGKVSLDASIVDATLYSAMPSATGSLKDENNNTYSYQKMSGQKFANGGSVELTNDGVLIISGLSAGDKVQLKIALTNESTIRVLYQMMLTLLEQDSSRLFSALEMSVQVGGADLAVEEPDGKTKVSSGVKLAVEENSEAVVTIGLPISAGKDVQNIGIKMRCSAFAVQDTTAIHGVAIIEDQDGNINDYMTLQEAVNIAKAGETIYIIRGSEQTVGELVISKPLTFTSYNDEVCVFEDIHVRVIDDASVTFDHIGFVGDSYLDVSRATAVTVSNCEVDVNSEGIYDGYEDKYISGFIVSSANQLLDVKLEVKDSIFLAGNRAEFVAINVYMALADGSVIENNVFGTEANPFNNAVEIHNTVNKAAVRISGNTFYANVGVALNSKSAENEYSVVMQNNKLFGASSLLAKVNGVQAVDIYDNGSLVNGAAITFAAIDLGDSTRFCGLGVEFYDLSIGSELKVTAGRFLLSASYTEQQFQDNYVVSVSGSNVTFEK